MRAWANIGAKVSGPRRVNRQAHPRRERSSRRYVPALGAAVILVGLLGFFAFARPGGPAPGTPGSAGSSRALAGSSSESPIGDISASPVATNDLTPTPAG